MTSNFGQPQKAPKTRPFHEVTGCYRPQDVVDFVIPDLERDLRMGIYICVARGRYHPSPAIRKMYATIVDFFRRLDELLQRAKSGDQVAMQRALAMTAIREPHEIRLGYALDGSRGNGVGDGNLQFQFLEHLMGNPEVSAGASIEPDVISVLPDFGLDRVSDIMATVGKLALIEFTQECAANWQFLPSCMRDVQVINCWDGVSGTFVSVTRRLPVDDLGQPIILVPNDLARSAPPFSAPQYFRDLYGEEYEGPATKRDLLADAARHRDRLTKFAVERLKDPTKYRPRRALRQDPGDER